VLTCERGSPVTVPIAYLALAVLLTAAAGIALGWASGQAAKLRQLPEPDDEPTNAVDETVDPPQTREGT
jgi:hypothetical protein